MTTNQIMSREQNATMTFMTAANEYRRFLGADPDSPLGDIGNAFIVAFDCFGQSELRARHAERLEALKVKPGTARELWRESNGYNKKGVHAIANMRKLLKKLELEAKKLPKLSKEDVIQLEQCAQELRAQFADLEIKVADVVKLDTVLNECISLVRKEGLTAIPNWIDKKGAELAKARLSKNRGAVDNIPLWKVVAIAVFLGAWIYGFFKCWWWSCTLNEQRAAYMIGVIALAIASYC